MVHPPTLYVYTDEEDIRRSYNLSVDYLGPFNNKETDADIKSFLSKVESMTLYFAVQEFINPLTHAVQTCYEQSYRQRFDFSDRGIITASFDRDASRKQCDNSAYEKFDEQKYFDVSRNFAPSEYIIYIITAVFALIQMGLVFRYFARLQLYFEKL